MANYETTADLKEVVLNNCGELTDGTSEYDEKVITYLNRAQQGMLSGAVDLDMNIGEPFPWAINKYNKVINLPPMLQGFSVGATYNSSTITFPVAPTQNLQNWLIQFSGQAEVYRIASHVGLATTATLDAPFVQPTNANGSANIFLVDYSLGTGILRLCNPMITFYTDALLYNSEPGQITQCDVSEFTRQYPIFLLQQATPTSFCQTYKSDDMEVFVRFNAIPTALTRVEYNYVPVPAPLYDSPQSIPVIPRDHRVTLAYYASYYLLLDKNDNRKDEYRTLTISGLMACVKAFKKEKVTTNPNFGRQIPRKDLVNDYRRLWNWWWY